MREPTILSPFGEGYCRHCRFIVGLGPDGLMQPHSRGRNLDRASRDRNKLCKGSSRRPAPPSRVPYSSRKSRFRYEGPVARCPRCDQDVKVGTYGGLDIPYFQHHRLRIPDGLGWMCPMTGEPVPAGVEAR